MALISGRCKNCNGVIQFDEGLKKGFCSFCGTPFIAEEVVNNYNNYYNTQYNIQNANIKIDTQSVEKKIERAEVFLTKIKNYTKAEELFKQASEEAPADYRGWWGLVRTATKDLTDINIGKIKLDNIVKYNLKNAFSFASPEKLSKIKEKWNAYLERIQELNSKYNKQISDIQTEKTNAEKSCEKKINALENSLINENKRIEALKQKTTENDNLYERIKMIIIVGASIIGVIAFLTLFMPVYIENIISFSSSLKITILMIVWFADFAVAFTSIRLFSAKTVAKRKSIQQQIDEATQRITLLNQRIEETKIETKNNQQEYDKKIEKINQTIENG